MSPRDASAPRHVAVAAGFLIGAVVLGGGGSPNPGTELLLQLAFVAAALAWVWLPGRLFAPRSAGLWLICVMAVILPVVQLIPLPPAWWAGLPGQEGRIAALALVGREGTWQPLSNYPSRTLASLIAILPAVFAFYMTASLDARGRLLLAGTIMAMAIATAIVGALQLSFGSDAPNFYGQSSGGGALTGFFANRNATVDLLLIGMAAAGAFFTPSLALRSRGRMTSAGLSVSRRGAALALIAVLGLLFFAAVLTKSRTGIVLVAPVLAAVWLMLWRALADLGRLRLLLAAAALGALAMTAALALQGSNTALARAADRFTLTEDSRAGLWEDARFVISATWPVGVGVGGAQPALVAVERLEVLDPLLPNRVHNDYLELLVEGGLPGAAVLLVIAAVLAAMAWRAWRERPQDRHLTALGVTILAIAAAHSFVDYPLRSMALACIVGVGAGLLVAMPRRSEETDAAIEGARAAAGEVS